MDILTLKSSTDHYATKGIKIWRILCTMEVQLLIDRAIPNYGLIENPHLKTILSVKSFRMRHKSKRRIRFHLD
jgi:hypothetical protein